MYNLSDNLVLAVPLHCLALRGQLASLLTAPTISIITMITLNVALQPLSIGVTESKRVELTLS